MKRLAVVASAALAALLTYSPAQASATFEGDILVGHPATSVGLAAAEFVAACDTSSDLNGIDGKWFQIAGLGGQAATLTSDELLDADAWFYTADCGYIESDAMAIEGLGAAETGTIPANAAFVIVDGWAGSGHFTLTVG